MDIPSEKQRKTNEKQRKPKKTKEKPVSETWFSMKTKGKPQKN